MIGWGNEDPQVRTSGRAHALRCAALGRRCLSSVLSHPELQDNIDSSDNTPTTLLQTWLTGEPVAARARPSWESVPKRSSHPSPSRPSQHLFKLRLPLQSESPLVNPPTGGVSEHRTTLTHDTRLVSSRLLFNLIISPPPLLQVVLIGDSGVGKS